jgi:hypothetical protein
MYRDMEMRFWLEQAEAGIKQWACETPPELRRG